MDGFGQHVRDDGDSWTTTIVGGVHVIVIFFLFRWLWRCCRQTTGEVLGAEQAAAAAAATASPDQLQPKKSIITCYVLWLIGGFMGAHHYYLGRLVHGMVSTWTLNFALCGWLADALLIPWYVHSFNKQLTHKTAPHDGTWKTLLIWLPLSLLAVFALLAGTVCYAPVVLQKVGVVDIDRIAAQTQSNPYDILEVQRGASLSEAKSAYRKASLKWHPDRNVNCGKECEDKMSEITKAFDLVKKRAGGTTAAPRTWDEWIREIGKDWSALFTAVAGDSDR